MPTTAVTRAELVSAARQYRHAFTTEQRAGARFDSMPAGTPDDVAERIAHRYESANLAWLSATDDLVAMLREAGLCGIECDGTCFIDAHQGVREDMRGELGILMVPVDRIG